MSEATASAAGPAEPEQASKSRRTVRIVAWIVGLVLLLGLLNLVGIDVRGWLSELWDTVTEISFGYIVLGCLFQGLQTVLTALGWYGILRYAYPGGVTFMPVLASYAAGVALNNFLPANIGTFVTLLMYVAVVRGSTFPGVLAGYVVQKIFYFIIGTLIYIYLFWAVAGSFDFQFGNERDAVTNHAVLILGIVFGAIFLLVLLARIFWGWVKKMWARAKKGAAILGDLRAYVKLVLIPQIGGYVAKVMVIIVFLAAYCDPGDVRLGDERSRLEPAREHPLVHARRRRHQPGVQLVRARQLHGLDDRDRLFDLAAADHDGVQRRLCGHPHLRRVRLERRVAARPHLLFRREGEGGRDAGESRRHARRRGRRARVGLK